MVSHRTGTKNTSILTNFFTGNSVHFNDVAILKLNTSVPIGATIAPISLPDETGTYFLFPVGPWWWARYLLGHSLTSIIDFEPGLLVVPRLDLVISFLKLVG